MDSFFESLDGWATERGALHEEEKEFAERRDQAQRTFSKLLSSLDSQRHVTGKELKLSLEVLWNCLRAEQLLQFRILATEIESLRPDDPSEDS